MKGEVKTSTLIVITIILALIAGALLVVSNWGAKQRALITNFDECVAAGNPIMESFPEQCRTQDGRMFVNPRQQAGTPPLTTPGTNDCVPAGCSGEICADVSEADGIVSSCVYLPEFACYKTARCERQASGTCGWTQTTELRTCIQSSQKVEVEPMAD